MSKRKQDAEQHLNGIRRLVRELRNQVLAGRGWVAENQAAVEYLDSADSHLFAVEDLVFEAIDAVRNPEAWS